MNGTTVNGLEIETAESRKIISLFLALNTFGYDDENNPKGMSAIRRAAKKAIKRDTLSHAYTHLQNAFETCDPWFLISITLNPKRNAGKKDIHKFLNELKTFSKEPAVNKLLQKAENAQSSSNKILLPILVRELKNIISLVGKPPHKIRKIVLIANPLDAFWRGYGIPVEDTIHIVVGPGAEQNHGATIRHELLHIFAKRIKLPSSFAVRPSKNLSRQGYGSQNVLREEYIVRALDILYRHNILGENISSIITHEQREFHKIKSAVKIIGKKIGLYSEDGGHH